MKDKVRIPRLDAAAVIGQPEGFRFLIKVKPANGGRIGFGKIIDAAHQNRRRPGIRPLESDLVAANKRGPPGLFSGKKEVIQSHCRCPETFLSPKGRNADGTPGFHPEIPGPHWVRESQGKEPEAIPAFKKVVVSGSPLTECV